MEYTKGKWEVYQTDVKPDRWMVCAGDTGKRGIAKTVLDNVIPPAEKQANANLIASAPDLYEALKGILPELKEYANEVGDCDHSVGICFCGLFNKLGNIEQALAKADGGK